MSIGSCKISQTCLAVIATLALVAVTIPIPSHATATAPLETLGNAFVQVAEKVTPAVVNISSTRKIKFASGPGGSEEVFKNHPLREFFGDDFFKRFFKNGPPGRDFRSKGMGSGVIVSSDGYILTNNHVVRDADEIKVTLPDKRSFKAKVVGTDKESDIAVIKIDAKDLPTASLGDSDKLRVGEIVLAVGNPFGLNKTVTSGIVSAKGRTNVGIIDYEDFIQTDAAINPGNSGGPLVNIKGQVVGINTAIASRSGGYQGIGFAIPSNSVKLIMADLIKEGKVRRGLLGVNIQNLTADLAKSFKKENSEGALVTQVIPGSAAEKAGVKDGDIIIKFNGELVKGAAELKNMVGKVKPSTDTTLTVFRDGKTVKLSAKIGERTAKADEKEGSSSSSVTSNELGIEVDQVPAAVAEKLKLPKGTGVRITEVEPDGAGSKMGLMKGDVILDVNGTPVKDVSSFNAGVAKAKKKKLIRVKLQRGKMRIFLGRSMG
jgi:serine protease Do